jgi:antitoxin (DNA-binding transcriptional repressor) of toxin-antitoxin stability system
VRSVEIKILENELSEYIRIASEGETVLVTDRDRVVAEITAPRPGRSETVTDALIAEAVRKGWITPPVVRHALRPRQPVAPLAEILEELSCSREDR